MPMMSQKARYALRALLYPGGAGRDARRCRLPRSRNSDNIPRKFLEPFCWS